MRARRVLLNIVAIMVLNVIYCYGQVAAKGAPKSYQVVFHFNDYLATDGKSPYPVVNAAKIKSINTKGFLNVMDFGARGDGKTFDDLAIKTAFDKCPDGGGVIFPTGRTFVIKNLQKIILNKDMIVYAYGATIKMAANTKYNAIAFVGQKEGYSNNLIWLGGTFDGNKNQQPWPGSPTNNNKWNVGMANYGLLTVRSAEFALIKDVELINTVYDGLELYECKLAVFDNCKAKDGVEFNYHNVKEEHEKGKQASYFKVTRTGSQDAYFLNLTADGGSIGAHYSAKPMGKNSLAVVSNCNFSNQAQDALHFEHTQFVLINRCTVLKTKAGVTANVHISNASEVVSVTNSTFKGGRVDFNNRTNLKYGLVQDCTFETPLINGKRISVPHFVNLATHINRCSFKGITSAEQVSAKYISESTFDDFDIATKALTTVTKSKFNNGRVAILNPQTNFTVNESIFNNISAVVNSNRKAGQLSNVFIYGSTFSGVESNVFQISELDTLLIDNSKFLNIGTNRQLPLPQRTVFNTKKTAGKKENVIVKNSNFSKSSSTASDVFFSDSQKRTLISNNLTVEGKPLLNANTASLKANSIKMFDYNNPFPVIRIVNGQNRSIGTIGY